MQRQRLQRAVGLALLSASALWAKGGALEDYVARPDTNFVWHKTGQSNAVGLTITRLKMVSQQWREFTWTHDIQVVRPEKMRNPHLAFLLISGDGSGRGQLPILRALVEESGAMAAVVTRVPNQPFFGDRKEDALIAYTFLKYLDTGDESWPLLFPMTKSAVRAMDAVQEFAKKEYQEEIKGFVVGGASKRGWTTWLTATVDGRVKGIAPMVIDMLNMKAQLNWSQKVYGRQSEMIHDYTEIKLQERMDEPGMVKLRSWVDPYSHRERYTMPKLILLGSNDPYWTVDSLKHYWNELPGPKLVYITPNAGHDLAGGKDALPTLAAFFGMLADGRPLPKVEWSERETTGGKAEFLVNVSQPIKAARLWTTDSQDRDFRNDTWTSSLLEMTSGATETRASLATPEKGYQAYMLDVLLKSPTGLSYKLSTEARVRPDGFR
jgi:PhoPQ-activated pathogenicity-related protein